MMPAVTNTEAANQEMKLSSRVSLVRCLTGLLRGGRQQGACSSTLCGRIGFKQRVGLHAGRTRSVGGGWSSSGPTEVWLHGHDLGGKAREITRAKKLYGFGQVSFSDRVSGKGVV